MARNNFTSEASLALFPLPVNVLAMNLATGRIDYRYLKVLIVAQASFAEVLSKHFAVLDSLQVAFKVDPDPVSHRHAIFHIEEEFLHGKPQIAFNN
jgi:hypothetical protein